MENKTCEFCGKKFETSNPRKKYCKTSCKTRAYELRRGKEVPEFLIGNEYDIILKENKVIVDNPKYIELNKQLKIYENKIKSLKKQREEYLSKISIINDNSSSTLGLIGGGGLGYYLSSKIENPLHKTFATIVGAVVGSQITKPSKVKKKAQETKLNNINKKIDNISNLIKSNEFNISSINLELFSTPKEKEEIEIQEIKVPKRKGLVRKDKNNAPFITASELTDMHFDLYELKGRFGKFLGNIAKNSFITAYGKPGSGKSTFFIQLANFFTESGMVIYITPEEGISPTFKQKLTNQDISTDNIHITAHTTLKEIRKALKTYDYQFCFIDSVNMLSDVKPELLEKLRTDFPNVLFAIIMQSTKDGKFKGSNEYAHNSDINIKVEQGLASTIKNRFNELREYEVFKDYN